MASLIVTVRVYAQKPAGLTSFLEALLVTGPARGAAESCPVCCSPSAASAPHLSRS